MSEQRQRPDGTLTYSTPAWDATWYWPVGTRVRFRTLRGVPRLLRGLVGTVTKQNAVTVTVTIDDGRLITRVSFEALERMGDPS